MLRPFLSVLCWLSFRVHLVSGSPTSIQDQVILSGYEGFNDDLAGSVFYDSTTELLNDAKKAILKGKKNMQKWFHDGREYIKQNGLLCE